MAALTKRHEVALVVRTAACQRQNVMHFFGGRYPTFLFTLLAQRMRLDINPSNAPPRATIPLVGVRIATVSVVLTFGDLPVLGHLFRSNTKASSKREMLVFITPKMLSQARSTSK